MDRRKALQNMGLALGYTVAAPTLISIAQSCKQEKELGWTPDFFSPEEGSVMTRLVDIIIPKTDTPSASEVQAHLFIDRFANQVMDEEQQNFWKHSMGAFINQTLEASGKDNAGNLTVEDLEPILARSLKVSDADKAANFEAIRQYHEAVAEGQQAELEPGISSFAFANNLRGMTIMAYKTSEYVGEQVLSYLPVPGEYIACGDVQELTGGKAWSL